MHEHRSSHLHRLMGDDDLIFMRRLIAEHPGSSRHELSKKLCVAWNGVQSNGTLRAQACRSLMFERHRQCHIQLPPVRCVPRNPLAQHKAAARVDVDQAPLRMSLAELGAVELRHLRRTGEEAVFDSLLQHHHYLGYTQPVGEHLKHLISRAGGSLPARRGARRRAIRAAATATSAGARARGGPTFCCRGTAALADPAVDERVAPGLAPARSHRVDVVGRLAARVRSPDLFPG